MFVRDASQSSFLARDDAINTALDTEDAVLQPDSEVPWFTLSMTSVDLHIRVRWSPHPQRYESDFAN